MTDAAALHAAPTAGVAVGTRGAASALRRIRQALLRILGLGEGADGFSAPLWPIIAASIVILFATWGVVVALVQAADREAMDDAYRRAETLSKTVAEHVNGLFSSIEQKLRFIAYEIDRDESPGRIKELVDAGTIRMDHLLLVTYVNPQGHTLANNFGVDNRTTDRTDRPHIRVHIDSRHDGIFIGAPIIGRVSNVWTIHITHARRAPDGSLRGIIVAALDALYFGQFWQSLDLRRSETLELVGQDGRLRAHWPLSDPSAWESDRPPESREGPLGRRGADEGHGPGDRPYFLSRVREFPLLVVAGFDRATVLDGNASRKQAYVLVGLAVTAAIALLNGLLAVRTRRLNAEHQRAIGARRQLRNAIEALPIGFMMFDHEHKLKLFNRRIAEFNPDLSGRQAQATTYEQMVLVASERRKQKFPDVDWDAWAQQTLKRIASLGTTEELRPDGGWLKKYEVATADGGLVGIQIDITEIKKREEALAASERRLQREMAQMNSVVQSTGAQVVLVDRKQRVVLANRGFLALTGRTEADVVARRMDQVLPYRLDPAVRDRWLAAKDVRGETPVEFETVLSDAEGRSRVINVTANPVPDETGRLSYIGFLGVDDTARREAELRLFNASRLATLGEMASGIAHEINQPLSVIRFAAESLADAVDESELPDSVSTFLRQKLARIANQTERAATIVRDLRMFARKPDGDGQPFDVVEAVRTAVDMIDDQLALSEIKVTVEASVEAQYVAGHANRLQQVVLNLLTNARDALTVGPDRRGGSIAVSLRAGVGSVHITIEDNGTGIPEHVLPRLFDPFFTTKEVGKGTGLGLSISRQIVEEMKGTMSAENRPEGGARFIIVLPRSAPPAAQETSDAAAVLEAAAKAVAGSKVAAS